MFAWCLSSLVGTNLWDSLLSRRFYVWPNIRLFGSVEKTIIEERQSSSTNLNQLPHSCCILRAFANCLCFAWCQTLHALLESISRMASIWWGLRRRSIKLRVNCLEEDDDVFCMAHQQSSPPIRNLLRYTSVVVTDDPRQETVECLVVARWSDDLSSQNLQPRYDASGDCSQAVFPCSQAIIVHVPL